jgi:Ca2+-binding RTX toxin-like protein
MAAPVVPDGFRAVQENQWVLASSLFTVTDADGDAITQYDFVDTTAAANSAYIWLNGTIFTAGTIFTPFSVAAADLPNVWVRGGAIPLNDGLQVRAYDSTGAVSTWNIINFQTDPPNQGPAVFHGSSGNDSLQGTSADDTMYGADGNDILNGGAGNDILDGGNGNDTYIVDSSGDSVIDSAITGTDTVQSYVPWILAPDIENLTLLGSASYGVGNFFDNVITGNDASNPLLRGGAGNDQIYGGAGDDWLEGDDSTNLPVTGNDYIQGDDGNDTVLAGPGDDTVHGGNDTDTIVGEGGNDVLYGDAGIDYVDGRQGNDQLFGGDGNDIIFGDGLIFTYGFGGDTIHGDAGDDILMGECGDHTAPGALDVIYGDAGNDLIYGGSGNDWIFGGDGIDVIDGGDGSDFIVGGAGTDMMVGSGDSRAAGGPGPTTGGDLFSYGSLADGSDQIWGFDTNFATGNDGFDLRSIFDAAGYAGNTPRADGYLFVFQNGANTDVYVDGNGAAGGVNLTVLATLHDTNAASLTDSFFLFQ